MSTFFINLCRYLQVKVHQRYQRHQRQIFHQYGTTSVVNTGDDTGINDKDGNLPPVSTLVENLPQGLMTPLVNNRNTIRLPTSES